MLDSVIVHSNKKVMCEVIRVGLLEIVADNAAI
jgi:hypothetical protein